MFYNKLDIVHSSLFTEVKNAQLIGFSVFNKNSILLMCVDENFRCMGIGNKLLKQTEAAIKAKGYHDIILGQGDSYLFQGVPYTDEKDYSFFQNHGYTATRISADLIMDLKDFSLEACAVSQSPKDIIFRYAEKSDHEALLFAVNEVAPDWCRYFENTENSVLLATENNEPIGFCIVEKNGTPYSKNTGGIGCVGVVPRTRNRGIGLQMVANATADLKNVGCEKAFIGFTDLVDWYGKLGYRIWMRFWMGSKTFADSIL